MSRFLYLFLLCYKDAVIECQLCSPCSVCCTPNVCNAVQYAHICLCIYSTLLNQPEAFKDPWGLEETKSLLGLGLMAYSWGMEGNQQITIQAPVTLVQTGTDIY